MSASARLPTHLEVSALLRRVAAEGGFAVIVAKGEPDSGTILLITRNSRTNPTLWERMPQLNGMLQWVVAREQDADKAQEFDDYLLRRKAQDPDVWIVELDVPNPERFVGDSG